MFRLSWISRLSLPFEGHERCVGPRDSVVRRKPIFMLGNRRVPIVRGAHASKIAKVGQRGSRSCEGRPAPTPRTAQGGNPARPYVLVAFWIAEDSGIVHT